MSDERTTELRVAVAGALLLLSGCEAATPTPKDSEALATAKAAYRAERFDTCMKLAPAGPQVTKYNDWAEVVDECGQQALYQMHTRFP